MVARGLAANEQMAARHLTFAVLDVRAAVDDLASDGVERAARLRAEQHRRFLQVVVDGGQVENIGNLDEVAVLVDLRGQRCHGQLAALGGHAFGDGRERLRQRIILAELDLLALALGDVSLLREAVMHQLGFGVVDQGIAVVGLHLARETGIGRHVRLALKQAQNDGQNENVFELLHRVLSPFLQSVNLGGHQNTMRSPRRTRLAISARSAFVNLLGSLLTMTPGWEVVPFSFGRIPFARTLSITRFSISAAAFAALRA